MTNKEIYESSGHAFFDFANVRESEKLVHWVKQGGGFMRVKNPNGCEFFVGKFSSDNEAAEAIESIKASIKNDVKDQAINEATAILDCSMPVINGIRYVLNHEDAYYLARAHRPMDDILVISEEVIEHKICLRLLEYNSGKYAS